MPSESAIDAYSYSASSLRSVRGSASAIARNAVDASASFPAFWRLFARRYRDRAARSAVLPGGGAGEPVRGRVPRLQAEPGPAGEEQGALRDLVRRRGRDERVEHGGGLVEAARAHGRPPQVVPGPGHDGAEPRALGGLAADGVEARDGGPPLPARHLPQPAQVRGEQERVRVGGREVGGSREERFCFGGQLGDPAELEQELHALETGPRVLGVGGDQSVGLGKGVAQPAFALEERDAQARRGPGR